MSQQIIYTDYELPVDQQWVWIMVDNLSVHEHRTDEGVVVDLFPKRQEMGSRGRLHL
jgi:hypothetical protein